MLPLSIILTIAALLLTFLAIRGSRVDDAPLCRRCRFDLTGLDARICPECGRDLTRRRAVRHGRRRSRRALLVVALIALVGSGGLTGALTWQRATGVDWHSILPTWLLIEQADRGDLRALRELHGRAIDETLSAAHCRRLADLALDAQQHSYEAWMGTSPATPLTPAAPLPLASWSDLFETLRLTSSVTTGQMDRYYEQAVGDIVIEVDTEREATVHRALPIMIGFPAPRITLIDQGDLELWIREITLESHGPAPLDDYPPGEHPVRIRLRLPGPFPFGAAPVMLIIDDMHFSPSVAAGVARTPGTYQVTARYQIELRRANPDFDVILWTRHVDTQGTVTVP